MIAKLARFSLIPFTRTLKVKPTFRQVRQGINSLSDCATSLKLTPMGTAHLHPPQFPKIL